MLTIVSNERTTQMAIGPNVRVSDVLAQLRLAGARCRVNGLQAGDDTPVRDGDTLEIQQVGGKLA